jgi:hypothetical protein
VNCTVVLVGARGIVDCEGYWYGWRKSGGTLVDARCTIGGGAKSVIVEVDEQTVTRSVCTGEIYRDGIPLCNGNCRIRVVPVIVVPDESSHKANRPR